MTVLLKRLFHRPQAPAGHTDRKARHWRRAYKTAHPVYRRKYPVHDHVMARRIYRMQEQLAQRRRDQTERALPGCRIPRSPHPRADPHATPPERLRGIEQAAPHPNIFCTVTAQ